MHYLQSLLTLLIASNIPAERIWGILNSAEFVFHEDNVIRHERGWLSVSALRQEMEKRASLCAKLFKELEPRIVQLSALSWKSTYFSLSSGNQLIRYQDGSIECQALQKKLTIHATNEAIYNPKPEPDKPWRTDPGLDAYQMRMYRALMMERFFFASL